MDPTQTEIPMEQPKKLSAPSLWTAVLHDAHGGGHAILTAKSQKELKKLLTGTQCEVVLVFKGKTKAVRVTQSYDFSH